MRSLSRLFTFLLMFALQVQTIWAEEPAPNVPELKVLDQFVGKWEGTGPDAQKTISVIEWTLNGRFIKQEYSGAAGVKGMIMRGYAPSLKKYVMTMFDSTGTALMLTGDWDPQEKALACSGDLGNGIIMKVTSSFPDPNTEAYNITVIANGQIVSEFKGENQRVKN